MDETTLHTFLFHCPAALRSVVLLGSWDNFSRPYPLELYAPKWRNLWKGCFTFSDIICDGELSRLSEKRDGPLIMGGTYWYYYKVDEDEECHNPSEPSTTVCPLLPGQRLNVLEIPRELHSRTSSESSGSFTRNPKDRYLTPVPPAPLKPVPSPRLGAACSETYAIPLPSPWTPRSATYPPADAFLSPNVVRHARSASTSPRIPSTPIFADFKGLKEKLASKRSASRTRSSSKSSELEISSPVLVSTTADDLTLIPLPGFRSLPRTASSPAEAATPPVSRSIPIIRREFSPLGSHPVVSNKQPVSKAVELPAHEERITRRRSYVPSTVITSEFKLGQGGRIRANSADTRRTQHYLFSNDPWMSSPKLQQEFDEEKQVVDDDTPPAPTLQRPSSFLNIPVAVERPTSSHGGDRNTSLRQTPQDKALPELPRVMAPLPLHERKPYVEFDDLVAEPQSPASEITDHYFANGDDVAEGPQEPFNVESYTEVNEDKVELDDDFPEKSRSHFSTWSSDSLTFSCPTTDDEGVQSPTFSSLASNSSDFDTPQRLSIRFAYAELPGDTKRSPTILEEDETPEDDASSEDETHTTYLSPTPPQLEHLRISTFGSDLFSLDIQHGDSAPRRQAACFGLGFQYSLPEDKTTTTTAKPSINPEPRDTLQQPESRPSEPNVQRESSMSQLNSLMAEFSFLSDAVI